LQRLQFIATFARRPLCASRLEQRPPLRTQRRQSRSGCGEKAHNIGPILLAVEVQKNGLLALETELIVDCGANLELYRIPAKICFCKSFLKTPLGKISSSY